MKKIFVVLILILITLTACIANSESVDTSEQVQENTKNIEQDKKYETVEQDEVYEAIKGIFNVVSNYDKENIDKYFGSEFFSLALYNSEDVNKLIANKMDYQVYNITLNDVKDKAFAEIEITGIDMAKSYYELEMFYEFMNNSNNYDAEKDKETTIYIVNRNIDNTRTTYLNISLSKINNEWTLVRDVNIQEAIMGSSISWLDMNSKAELYYNDFVNLVELSYNEDSELTKDEYVNESIKKFIDEYMEFYINLYPFEDAFDVE